MLKRSKLLALSKQENYDILECPQKFNNLGGKKMTKKVVDKRYAKGKEYKEVIEAIDKENKCPFCPDNFKYHKKPIYRHNGNWFITENSWPYKNADRHFIILGKEHKENFRELTAEDLHSVKILVDWMLKKYQLKGGALCIRFGETCYTGATVCHLHFHLIIPELGKNKKAKTVVFPIG